MSNENSENSVFEKYAYLAQGLEAINTFLQNGDKYSAKNYLEQLTQQDDISLITWIAIKNNYLDIAKDLLKKGANPNIIIKEQLTSLQTMAFLNNIEGVELLLSFGASPELGLKNGETPLWTACRYGFNLVAYKLLLAGANPNVTNNVSWTPLMLATYMQNNELAFLLLQANADPNIANSEGDTPIFYSILDKNKLLTNELLQRGATLDIVNLRGQTPETFTMSSEAPILYKISWLIDFHRASRPIQEKVTKFGGQPVWVASPSWPVSTATGKPMTFICQVKLEKELFPNASGEMAYIFMAADEDQLGNTTYLPEGGENAVIIQPGNIPSFINTNSLSTGPSIQADFAVSFTPTTEPFYSEYECYHFITTQPKDQEKKYWQLFGKTKIGGTPVYIQGEEFPGGEEWTPLLQINTEDVPFYINLGDGGVAYIFINQQGDEGRMLCQSF